MTRNNRVSIIGETVSGFIFSHEVFEEGFYVVNVTVDRLSGQVNITPLIISERLIDVHKDYSGCTMESISQLRSYSRYKGVKNQSMLPVFVRGIHFVEEFMDYIKTSQIFLSSYIYKPLIYGKTPLEREIAGVLLAVNRPYGKSDYTPYISWGHNARFVFSFEVGTRVRVWGCVQSREYTKKLSETRCEKHTVYEVSINKLECDEA